MRYLISLLLILITPLALAQTNLVYLGGGLLATRADSSCAVSADPYENPVRYTENSDKFSGLCMDTERFRAAVVIKETADRIVVANYKHQDEYFTAEISKSAAVDQVYFQVVRFNVVSGVTAAHTQFRVRFKPGSEIKLISQLNAAKTLKLNDIVISYEAARPKGIPYNFALGAFNNYAIVARVMSGEQRQSESTKQATEQYPLQLESAEKLDLLIAGLKKSAEMGASRLYNTIRPNCTTEVFDLIDKLPSVQRRRPLPFLTVVSNNPIAGPSLEALAARGILIGKAPDLKDELEKKDFSAPVAVQPEAVLELPFLTKVEGWPYSLIDVSHKELPAARQLLYDAAPGLLQTVGSSSMTVENAEQVLVKGLRDLSTYMQAELVKMNDKLPLSAKYVRLFFAPWNGKGEQIEPLVSKGIPARFPFQTYEMPENGRNFYLSSGFGYLSDLRYQQSDKPYFMGASLILKLQRNLSEVKIQVLLGLQPRELNQELAKNDQVHLTQLVIPEASSRSYRPVVLANLTAAYKSEPSLSLEFGADGGLKPGSFEYQMSKDVGSCKRQAESVPTLMGQFGPKAHDNGIISKILAGTSVNLSIFAVDLDLDTREVQDMDIRISNKWPLKCMSDDSVDSQFSSEVNAKLGEIKSQLVDKGSADGSWLSTLGKLITQASGGDFSGLD